MIKYILAFFLVMALCSFHNTNSFVSTSPLPTVDTTHIGFSDSNSDSLWWGIWQLDSIQQGGKSFRVEPMYYYFLPDNRFFYLHSSKNSIADLNTYQRTDFYIRKDSLFTTNVAFNVGSETKKYNANETLEFVYSPISQRQQKIIFRNGNVGWIKHIFQAKKGENSFFKVVE